MPLLLKIGHTVPCSVIWVAEESGATVRSHGCENSSQVPLLSGEPPLSEKDHGAAHLSLSLPGRTQGGGAGVLFRPLCTGCILVVSSFSAWVYLSFPVLCRGDRDLFHLFPLVKQRLRY